MRGCSVKRVSLLLSFILLLLSISGMAQEGAEARSRGVLGEVQSMDPDTRTITIQTANETYRIRLGGNISLLRVKPGERTLDNAEPISPSQISHGDRVFVQGLTTQEDGFHLARRIIVMSQAEIARKQEFEREEWRRRGIAGVVEAIDPNLRQLSVRLPGRQTGPFMALEAPEGTRLLRYAPDSVKFNDAVPSEFADIKVGDQLRALGETSSDGTRYSAEIVVSGTFTVVGGPILAMEPDGRVKIDNLQTQTPLTVVVTADSVIKRVPPGLSRMLAMRAGLEEGESEERPQMRGSRRGTPGGGPSGRRSSGDTPRPPGGEGRPQRGEGGFPSRDMGEMMERLPAINLDELKPGDFILVSSTAGRDPSTVTAIQVLAGLDALMQRRAERGVGEFPDSSFGLPTDLMDMGVGLPPN
jgi:hypothetical protein